MAERAKLQDVAKLAGVSIGTASHAVTTKRRVLPHTVPRVGQVAAQLGYPVPRRATRSSNQAIRISGVIIKRTAKQSALANSLYSYILHNAESVCQQQNIAIMSASYERY